MKQKHAVIISALITALGTIIGAIIGVAWSKNNVTLIVQLDGKNVVLNDVDAQEMASENEELKKQISQYEDKIEELEKESTDLTTKLGVANGELDEVPSIEFQNMGLSIDGDEKTINKDKSFVSINGRQYYSKDFVDNLLPDNTSVATKNGMLYIGKVVKEKANLLDFPVIASQWMEEYDSVIDTYGNTYGKSLYFKYKDCEITYNANREYSKFKCTLATKEGNSGTGYLQIETDDGNVVYTSPEMSNLTEPFEIDIPINQTSKLRIKCVNSNGWCNIFVANAVLYNEE